MIHSVLRILRLEYELVVDGEEKCLWVEFSRVLSTFVPLIHAAPADHGEAAKQPVAVTPDEGKCSALPVASLVEAFGAPTVSGTSV